MCIMSDNFKDDDIRNYIIIFPEQGIDIKRC